MEIHKVERRIWISTKRVSSLRRQLLTRSMADAPGVLTDFPQPGFEKGEVLPSIELLYPASGCREK